MMKLPKVIVILFALFNHYGILAQEKKTYYFNEKFDLLNETDFKKLTDDKERFEVMYETDTAFITLSYKAVIRGHLEKEAFDSLKSALKNSSKEDFKTDGFIVIDYNPGISICNTSNKGILTWNIYDNDYVKKLNKIHPNNHFWIYKPQSKASLKYHHSGRVNWIEDPNEIVEKMFFPFGPISCYGLVIISENGAYISYHTEYGKQDVWKFTEELKKVSKAND